MGKSGRGNSVVGHQKLLIYIVSVYRASYLACIACFQESCASIEDCNLSAIVIGSYVCVAYQ